MIEIVKLNTVENNLEEMINQVKDIFYLSSSIKEFSSNERKIAFFKRWCGDYISLLPEQFCLMSEGQKVLGYLSGCDNSHALLKFSEVPGYDLFADLFESYPAHFHINFHPDCRGRGLGSHLLQNYCSDLKVQGVKGVHLVTSPEAANVIFYQRLGFEHLVKRDFNQSTLLFMGKILD